MVKKESRAREACRVCREREEKRETRETRATEGSRESKEFKARKVRKGTQGATGVKGDTGEGVPAGGTAGQMLVKHSGTDYDTEWVTMPTIPTMEEIIYEVHNSYPIAEEEEF